MSLVCQNPVRSDPLGPVTVPLVEAKPEERGIRIFHQAVRSSFSFLKQTQRLDDLFAKSIPLPEGAGFLLPVCALHIDDEEVLALLTTWRNRHRQAYPSRFNATLESTRKWLCWNVLGTEDRMLFVVVNRHGRMVGHLGFANAFNSDCALEMDNIVRGVDRCDAGIMSKAMKALISWAHENLGPRECYLRVLDDNTRAIRFYERLGFVEAQRLPLRRFHEGDNEFLRTPEPTDAAPPDCYFVRMVYRPKRTFHGKEMLLTAGPSISARELSYALDATRHGWNHQWDRYIRKFETGFAEYIGVKHALSTSSCTGALHLALLALGIGPGDEVILPELTWVATANAVRYTGATPIFADVEADSWCLDPDSFESQITPRTKAVIPVHLYGHPARMDEILEVARRHELRVVEDAAPSIGAEFLGRRTGSFGDLACFSFQGAKLLVTGEGGMLLTNDTNLYHKVRKIWDQGRVPGTFWIDELGWKYKMANVQAALGLGQLERVDELVEAKRRVHGWYEEGLARVPHIWLHRESAGARSIYWMTSILLEDSCPLTRDQLRAGLKRRNVDTRDVFPAISQYPIWPVKQAPQPRANRIGTRAINLPSGVCLQREHVNYICGCIRELIEGKDGET
jgi:perosamine synthetase